jgi:hypothetical protein
VTTSASIVPYGMPEHKDISHSRETKTLLYIVPAQSRSTQGLVHFITTVCRVPDTSGPLQTGSRDGDGVQAGTRPRDRVLASMGCDPLRCARCSGEMILWQVRHLRQTPPAKPGA